MSKCMDGILQYEQIDCHCTTTDTDDCMSECLMQKFDFTANLLSLRLFCAIVRYNQDNNLYQIDDATHMASLKHEENMKDWIESPKIDTKQSK